MYLVGVAHTVLKMVVDAVVNVSDQPIFSRVLNDLLQVRPKAWSGDVEDPSETQTDNWLDEPVSIQLYIAELNALSL